MQIHELTLKQKTQVNEGPMDFVKSAASKAGGLASKVAGGVSKATGAVADIKGAYRSAQVDQKTSAIADKAYRAWSAYRQQLDKTAPGGKADPATLEKQLLAFVSKNLLGGQYFQNLINKDQILGLVKQIAGSSAQSSTGGTIEKTATGLTHTASPTNPNQPSAPGVTPVAGQPVTSKPTPGGAGAFGQMAGTLGGTSTSGTATPTTPAKTTGTRSKKVPSTPAGKPFTTPSGAIISKPGDPSYNELIKKAQTSSSANPVQEAVAPAQELELFKKLVAAAAQAQTEISTGQGGKPGIGSDAGASGKKVQDPRAMVGDVQKVVGPTVDPGKLKAAGDAIRRNFQIDASIGSTDDDAVDALLISMGFQPA